MLISVTVSVLVPLRRLFALWRPQLVARGDIHSQEPETGTDRRRSAHQRQAMVLGFVPIIRITDLFGRAVPEPLTAASIHRRVRRIDPSTGQPIVSDVEAVRQNIGADWAMRL